MDLLLLRLVHILGAVFWVGAAYVMFLFLQPTAQATAPESQRFMLHLLGKRHLTEAVLVAALLTGGAGALLFLRDSGGLRLEWMAQPQGLGFTVGGVAGGVALLLFLFGGYPAGRRLVAIGSRVQAEGRPPTEAEGRALIAAQQRLRWIGALNLVLLGIAAVAMATARYLPLIV
jgi:uncharacterized membrane protein